MVKDEMNLFKDKILQQHGCTISENDLESYQKTLGTQLDTRGYKSYFPARKWGGGHVLRTFSGFRERVELYNMMNENKPSLLTKEHTYPN